MWLPRVLAGFVAVEHFYIFVVEALFYTTRYGRRVFGVTPEFAESTKMILLNQGFYNLFLAAGLAWSLATGQRAVVAFFLGCVVVAGIVGGATVLRRIFYLQAAPAAVALAAVAFAWY